ncbi:MAG: ATP-binding cassette domain-containing protein [Burkholderiales bacterium]|nr:ATP-binding cassette domain-containing protein [Burkholderiales bacterium]MBP6677029.1 ATP-binding cassette domain-containing protein [Vitreoscilla sp.]
MPTTPTPTGTARPAALFTAQGLAWPGPPVNGPGPLTFTITPGLTLVRGGEGRGKSSLLRLMAGLVQPDSGRVQRMARALCFESPADPAHDPEVACAWLQARRGRFDGWHAGVEAALVQAFGLAEHMAKPLYMLSAGSRRKVGLVAAAASGAQLTLIDSPFAALDARSCRVLEQLLAEAAMGTERAWVVADYALPAGLADVPLAGVIDLGD